MQKYRVTAGDTKVASFLVAILEDKTSAARTAAEISKHYNYVAIDGKQFNKMKP